MTPLLVSGIINLYQSRHALLGSGVGLFIGASDMFAGQMGINLCAGYVSMPQQFLNRPQVSAAAQHVSGKTMPKRVGADLNTQVSRLGILLQLLPEALPGQSVPAGVEEKGCLAFIM